MASPVDENPQVRGHGFVYVVYLRDVLILSYRPKGDIFIITIIKISRFASK
jgi:hypothetical protein